MKMQRITAFMAAMAMIAASLIAGLVSTTAAADQFSVLFVSASPSLPGGDSDVRDHLTASGHAVTVVDDNVVAAADAVGHDLVIVSTTVAASRVGDTFAATDVPVITWERLLYDEFGLTASAGASAETSGTTTISIADPGNPIAAGLSGSVEVTTQSRPLSYGTPAANAVVIATDTSSLNRPVVFSYEAGDTLADGSTAAGRRVALFFSYGTAKFWTTDAQSMFDAAVDWAVDAEPPANQAPVVDAGADVVVGLDTPVVLNGSVADDGLPAAATVMWSGPAGVTFADATDPTTTVVLPGVGVYDLTLTADDGEFTDADTVVVEVSATVPPAAPEVLWVSNKPTLTNGDEPGAARLEAKGMVVTVVDDDAVVQADSQGKDLIVISSTISPGKLGTWYTDLAVPMFVWEAFVYDDLDFAAGDGTKGQASNLRRIDIENSDHPAAGGLTGSPTVLNASLPMSWAVPSGDADIIATLDNSPTRAAVFAYDQGVQMATRLAPARRLGFFLTYSGPGRLTDDGWTMWDAAIEWTLNGTPAPTADPVAALSADPVTGVAPLTTTFDASASTDDDDDIVSYSWDFGDGTSAAAAPTAIVEHTYTDAGSFTATVTVTDSVGGTDTATTVITVGAASGPSAVVGVDVSSGIAPLTVAFDGSASADTVGTIVSYQWDFGDGTTASGGQVAHTYESVASVVATLTVTNDEGQTDSADVPIFVGSPRPSRTAAGIVALYEFAETGGGTVADTSGRSPALDLEIADTSAVTHLPSGGLRINRATTLASSGPATKVIDSAIASDEITVEAWVDAANDTQNGPARIVSVSKSATRRNVTLGQGVYGATGDRLEGRVRTPFSGLNGITQTRSEPGTFGTGLTHVVLTRDTDAVITLYVDGEPIVVDPDRGTLGNWDTTMQLLLGSEADGSRAWLGDLHLVAIYDRALGADEVCRNAGAGPGHPIADGNAEPIVCLGRTGGQVTTFADITFDGADSGDPDGLAVNYAWDLGDGTQVVGPTSVTHDYQTPGDYTVTLTVTDDDGASRSTSIDVTISGGSPEKWTRIDRGDPRLPIPAVSTVDPQQPASLVADVSGDGIDDIVLANRTEPGASVMWYEFISASAGWQIHVIDDEPLNIEAGGDAHDIDGDGDIDIAFGGGNRSGDMWWWENPGPNGVTGPWTRHLLKSNDERKHHDMRFGDVDGDGAVELAFWNQHPSQRGFRLYVAEIPADPTQLWPTTEIVRETVDSEGLDIADIDGDGVDDMVGAGQWFKRMGDGSYQANSIVDDANFSRTVVGQLIPGGRPEVVIDSGDAIGPLRWFSWNATTGTWDSHELLATSTYGHNARIADIDGDGHLDIFSAEMVSPTNPDVLENPDAVTRVFYGDGAGSFVQEVVDTGFDMHESRVADLDGDGDIDIVGKPFNVGAPGINIWLNAGRQPFDNWDRTPVDVARPWTALFIEHVDIDGDDFDDIVTGGWWYRNPGTSGGTWARNTVGGLMRQMASVGDLDGDGDIDIIGTSWRSRDDSPDANFSWARNDGSGGFDVFPVGDTGDGPFLQGATLGQLTPGGPTELVLAWNTGASGSKTIVIPADLDTNPSQAPWATRSLSTFSEGEQVVIRDMDGDGDNDVFTGNSWLRQDAPATWVRVQIIADRANQPDRSVFADMDGDGDDDVVMGFGHGEPEHSEAHLSWFERPDDPSAMWPEHPMSSIVNTQSVDVADLDGDGDFDVVAGEHLRVDDGSGRLQVFENLGAGASFQTHSVHIGDEHHDGAQFVDLDNDGDLDVISIGFTQQRVVAYYNTTR